jgi:hypothetical protein
MRLFPLLLLVSGCSWLVPQTLCERPEAELASGDDPLTCEEARPAVTYAGLLAGHRLGRGDRNLILRDLAARYRREPADVTRDLAGLRAVVRDLSGRAGLEAAEARSHRAWAAVQGDGPLDPEAYPQAHRALVKNIAARATDDAQELVFTERDIEGWIGFASLCREVQGGGPLRLSISQREVLYTSLVSRFEAADLATRRAMVGLGPFWGGFSERWKAASYPEQQAWIRTATFPPPMDATSLAYAEAVFELPFPGHVAALHEAMGPMVLDGGR